MKIDLSTKEGKEYFDNLVKEKKMRVRYLKENLDKHEFIAVDTLDIILLEDLEPENEIRNAFTKRINKK